MTNATFQIGRGGPFYNAGHKSFIGFKSMSDFDFGLRVSTMWSIEDLEEIEGLDAYQVLDDWTNEDWDSDACKAAQKQLGLVDDDFRDFTFDKNGAVAHEVVVNDDDTGFVNQDHEYDTVIVKRLDECDEHELMLILKEDSRHGFKSYELDQILDDIERIARANDFDRVLELLE